MKVDTSSPAVASAADTSEASATSDSMFGLAQKFGAMLSHGGLPMTSPAPRQSQTGGSGGSSVAQTNSDLQSAMSDLRATDPKLYAQTLKDGQTGDGNALVEDELKAYQEGAIDKQTCDEEVSGAQGLANQNGGGKINKATKNDAKSVLGQDLIHGGKTRAGEGLIKFLESFTGIGAIVKGIGDKTAGEKPESILQAAQPSLQQGAQQAMQDMAAADPALAQQFQQDARAKDGNAMTSDLVALKNEESSGTVSDTFSDADAQLLGTQLGSAGKGKIGDSQAQAFNDAFGGDALDRGQSKAARGWDKLENGVGNMMQQIVSPVTDGVGGFDQLAKGNVKGALSDFGQALMGAVSDASMIVAPEAAPELEAGEMIARGGVEGAETLGGTGSSLTSLIDMANKGNDAFNDIQTTYGLIQNEGNQNATATA